MNLIITKEQMRLINEETNRINKIYFDITKKRNKRKTHNDRLYNSQYIKNRRKNDVSFRMKNTLSVRIRDVLRGKNKSLRTMQLLGCDIDYFLYYLQEQFVDGMNWNNHGRGDQGIREWHIDHIKPCASFDLSKPEEQRKCFHYSNLQPLWAKDNISKGATYNPSP